MLKLQNINDAMKMSPKTLLILTYLECINSQVAAMKALQLSVVQCHVLRLFNNNFSGFLKFRERPYLLVFFGVLLRIVEAFSISCCHV